MGYGYSQHQCLTIEDEVLQPFLANSKYSDICDGQPNGWLYVLSRYQGVPDWILLHSRHRNINLFPDFFCSPSFSLFFDYNIRLVNDNITVMLPTTAFVSLSLLLRAIHASTCYWPDGQANPNLSYLPCNDGAVSMCCATNRTIPTVNSCRPDGTCLEESTQTVWRESCTDPTWKDPKCLKLCYTGICKLVWCMLASYLTDPATDSLFPGGIMHMAAGDARMTVCIDGSYCCGYLNNECCSQNLGFWVDNYQVFPHDQNPFATVKASPTNHQS